MQSLKRSQTDAPCDAKNTAPPTCGETVGRVKAP